MTTPEEPTPAPEPAPEPQEEGGQQEEGIIDPTTGQQLSDQPTPDEASTETVQSPPDEPSEGEAEADEDSEVDPTRDEQ